jgi:ABC-2 type transport system ATP-binding protein
MTNIEKSFGPKKVLSDVTFAVYPKEIFGLLGPSGSGKTTIINLLTNQLKHEAGEKTVNASAFETGLMLDQDGLYERLSVTDNLELFASIYGISHESIMESLENVGLSDSSKKAVSELSKGMRQRLALARAILHTPKVLFLDEPTSGLDPVTAAQVHRLIEGLRDGGTTIFLTTHNMDEAVKLCDRIGLLHEGKIVEMGEPLEICERHNAMKTVPDLEKVFFKMTGANLV